MNFLAHMLLSCENSELMAGNFMADFVLNREKKMLHPNILKGIELHHSIDNYTDQHLTVKNAVSLLRPTQGKYSPVVVDILFDYFLTINWDKYSSESLEKFTSRVYTILTLQDELYPPRLKELLPRMISDDFLMSCKNEDRLIKTFERIKKRAKFDNNFNRAHLDLADFHDIMNDQFNEFFPDIVLHIKNVCKC